VQQGVGGVVVLDGSNPVAAELSIDCNLKKDRRQYNYIFCMSWPLQDNANWTKRANIWLGSLLHLMC
jgi:hypothetical protein